MLGIGLSVLAYTLFALHDASIKWLVAALPAWQVLFCRSAVIVLGCCVIGRRRLISRAVATPLKLSLAIRGAITLIAWLCYYTAARTTPLAQLVTLYFSAPILVTAMSAPLLGERVTGARWIAVAVGFSGVVVATNPLGLHVSLNTGLVLIAAILWAYGVILMRRIARRESSLLQMFYSNSIFLIGTGAACLVSWRTPAPADAVLLLAVGVLGGLGQFLLFEGARHAPAAVVATIEYSGLLWAFVLGYAIWHDVPRTSVSFGAALILFAGLLLLIAERRSARAASRHREETVDVSSGVVVPVKNIASGDMR